jgi:23S rRNA (cytosine1962-C5)-methyltransferase
MFTADQYQLLDFGEGRRLERFGAITLDRPCPTAEGVTQADPAAWRQADARFERTDDEQGVWTCRGDLPPRWPIAHGRLVLEMKRTDFGHVGLFPEQAENWDWIARRAAAEKGTGPICAEHPATNLRSVPGSGKLDLSPFPSSERPRVLNLFAYTGGSSLAAAAAGAEVVHVDAARNVVAWARRNAELSGLAEAPVRWIAEDATKFVKRELRRGSRYDAVILDPPSYGHGAHGEVWRLASHLPPLLRMCGELISGKGDSPHLCDDQRFASVPAFGPFRQMGTVPFSAFVLLTCHTPGYPPPRLADMMFETLGEGQITARPLCVPGPQGRELPSGVVATWERLP